MAASSQLVDLSNPRVLRIGVLVNSDPLPAADGELFQQMMLTDYLHVTVIAVVRPRVVRHQGSPGARALINLYRWMDRRTSGGGAAEAALLLASCTEGRTSETVVVEGASEKLTSVLAAHNLDVVACLSPFEGLRNLAVGAAFGVWWVGSTPSEVEGAEFVNNLFATAAANRPLSYCVWASTSAETQPFCLEAGVVPLVSGISVARNAKAVRLLRRNLWLSTLHRLAFQGWEVVRTRGAQLQPAGCNDEARCWSRMRSQWPKSAGRWCTWGYGNFAIAVDSGSG